MDMNLLPGDILGEIFGQLKWKNWALALALTCKKCLWAFQTINVKYVHYKYKYNNEHILTVYYGNLILFRAKASQQSHNTQNFDTMIETISQKDASIDFPYNSHTEKEFSQSTEHGTLYFVGKINMRMIYVSKQIADNSFIREIIILVKNTPIFDYFGAHLQTIDNHINVKKIKGVGARKMKELEQDDDGLPK